MSNVAWPTTDDVALAVDRQRFFMLTAEEFGVFVRMVARIAYLSVNSHYSDATNDPGLPTDELMLRRIVGCGVGEWRRSKKAVLEFFEMRDGEWHLVDTSIIRISKPRRLPIPTAVKRAVLARDGHHCAYCGSIDGPFHFDHIFPLSRGGSDDANNITVSCAACNMAKGDKTLQEWMQR